MSNIFFNILNYLNPVDAPAVGAGVLDLDHAEALGDESVVAVLDLRPLEGVHPPALKIVEILRVQVVNNAQRSCTT
jgi:hypothetical protein